MKGWRLRVFGAGLWLAVNGGIWLASQSLRQVVVDSWKKGPLIDPAAPYAPENAQAYFAWIVLWVLNSYLLGIACTFRLHQTWLKKIAPFALLLVSLFTAEFGMRVYLERNQSTHFRPHPTLHWMCRPNLKGFVSSSDGIVLNTNQHGMREVQSAYAKSEDEFRIVVLGDSSNFGQGVSGEEMWSSQLESLLQPLSQKKVRVLNASCPGWTTYQGVEVMERYGWSYQPDLVIAGFNNDSGGDFMRDRERVSAHASVRRIQSVLYRSEVFVITREAIVSWIRRWSSTADKAYRTRLAGHHSKYGKLSSEEELPLVQRVPLSEMKDNLQTLQVQAEAHRATFVWINMPINRKEFNLMDRYVDWNYRSEIADFTQITGIPYIGVDEYWQRTREGGLHILGHVFHPNAIGHQRMAQQIAQSLLADELVPIDRQGTIEIGGPTPANTPETLRLGWSSKTPIHAHLGLALQQLPELISKYNLEIELLSYTSGKTQGEDVANGRLDAWFSCGVPAIHMLDSRPDAKVVATLGELGKIAWLKGDGPVQSVGMSKGSTPHQFWATFGSSYAEVSPVFLKTEELEQSLSTGTVDSIVMWDPWAAEWQREHGWTVAESTPFHSVLIVSEEWALGDSVNPRVPRLIALLEELIVQIESQSAFYDSQVAWMGDWSLEAVKHIREGNTVFQKVRTLELDKKVVDELNKANRFVHPQSRRFYALAPEWVQGFPEQRE